MLVGSTEEQTQLGASARSLLGELANESEVRRLMATDDGVDSDGWLRLHDLGLLGLVVPERYGGLGGNLADLGVVLEQMGRCVYPGPYFATTVLAVQALLNAGDEGAAAEYLGRIAAGTTVATVALTEESGHWDEVSIQLGAARTGDGWVLDGIKTYVPDGARADLVIVAARTQSGVSLFAVAGGAEGLTRELLPTMDQTRKQARLVFESTPARLIGSEGAAWPGLERMLAVAAVAQAAEQVGGAEAVLELVVEHAQTREQFGKPIGSFQAVQHKCADMVVDIEAARSAAYYGLRALDEGAPDASVAASLAKLFCSAMYRRVTNEAVQILGGIGLTWEHRIHLYLKRARSSEVLFGTPAEHRERIAQLIEL
jgi:alkylation response protein AidB-like acyl-CoA dehydrogenase